MSSSRERTQALSERIDELIRYSEQFRDARDREREKREELARRIEEKEGRIAELEERVKELESLGALSGDAPSTKEAEKRIDGMIREIDRCIALLEP